MLQGEYLGMLLTIEDEELHRSHFHWRGREGSLRGGDRYLSAFKKIRKIQKYMVNSAAMRGVPVVEHYDLDSTLSQIIDHVIEKALESMERGVEVEGEDTKRLERAVEAVDRERKGVHSA